MSYQVGSLCYATKADAAVPACSAFTPVSSLNGSLLTTVSCAGVNPDGSLSMVRSVVDTAAPAAPVVTTFAQVLDYGPCIQSDYVEAFNSLLGPVLAVVVMCWGLWRISSYLGWGRADAS